MKASGGSGEKRDAGDWNKCLVPGPVPPVVGQEVRERIAGGPVVWNTYWGRSPLEEL